MQRVRIVVGTVLVAVLTLAAHAGAVAAGVWTASLANNATSAGSGALKFSHAYNSTSCATPVSAVPAGGIQNTACPSRLYPASGSTFTASDAITNNGSIPAAQLTGSLQIASCTAIGTWNSYRNTTDAFLPHYGATLNGTSGTAGLTAGDSRPLSGGGSVTLDGNAGYLVQSVQYAAPVMILAGAQSFGIWFKTTSTTGGGLYSFDTDAGIPGSADGTNRFTLDMLPSGKLVIESDANTQIGSATAQSYNDGKWHFVLYEYYLAVLGYGFNVYVDGNTSAVISGSNLALLVGGGWTEYWHLGWSQNYGYFAGSLSDFFLVNSNPANGSAFYAAANQAAFDTLVSNAGGTDYWKLADPVTTPYTGVMPHIGATNPCTLVTPTWNGTNLAYGVSASVPIANGGSAATSTMGVVRNAGYDTDACRGLQLYAPATITVYAGSTNQWSTSFIWNGSGSTLVM